MPVWGTRDIKKINFLGKNPEPLSLEANVLDSLCVLWECRELSAVRDYKILGFSNKTASLFALFPSGSASFITISTGFFFPLAEKKRKTTFCCDLHKHKSHLSYRNSSPTYIHLTLKPCSPKAGCLYPTSCLITSCPKLSRALQVREVQVVGQT